MADLEEELQHQDGEELTPSEAPPRRGEYSAWARAPRYCYDPRTLGNLVFPK